MTTIETLNKEHSFSQELSNLQMNIIKEQKEAQKKPWKFEYIGNKKDRQNRNRKFYSYTLVQGWASLWIIEKRKEQMWKDNITLDNFCDTNWNKIKKEHFNKWEQVYIKIPNTDIIDSTPEMTSNEIMNISKNTLNKIFSNINNSINHEDKNWKYIIINNKKLYYTLWKALNDNRTYIDIDETDMSISIGRKSWNKINWIFLQQLDNIYYKWNLKYKNWALMPEHY